MSTDRPAAPESVHFIRAIIDQDNRSGKWGGQVVTRFPPEPNGYLHIGHAKSICLNFGLAKEYGGRCHLRMDDTNPTKEDVEYVESIQEDVRWLGFDWGEHFHFASDYFARMFSYAEELILKGKAYVCFQTEEEMRATRGTVTEPGTPSPWRDTAPEENLRLFRQMCAGELPDGHCTLRAKIDMGHANMKMRDLPMVRIRHAHHHRTGDRFCVYPLYDFAHCLSDSVEGITHSICTLEFENNRELYDWFLDNLDGVHHPQQIEFARLRLSYTVMSKRKLLALVKDGQVSGWDDPRMPTIAGLRRRGVTPEAIRDFAERIGVAKANSTVSVELFESCIRDDLNTRAPRLLAVARPLKVTLTNWPEGRVEELDAALWPHDVPKEGIRILPFSGTLYIERDDFALSPPKGWHRLAPGGEVRLRHAYIIRCEDVVQDASGEVVELRCSVDLDTRSGSAAADRKVKGTIHWVSAAHAVPAELRLYSRLFRVEDPDAAESYAEALNPDSLEIVRGALVEPAAASMPKDARLQFERQGYFWADPKDSKPGALVFNRIISLKDSWAKAQPAAAPAPAAKKAEPAKAEPTKPSALSLSPAAEALTKRLGVAPTVARVLDEDAAALAFVEAAVAQGAAPTAAANTVVNDLLPAAKGAPLSTLSVSPAGLAALVNLVTKGEISTKQAKEVLAECLTSGEAPAAVVKRLGLSQLSDDASLKPLVDAVLAEHQDKLSELRGGNVRLLGFLVGQVLKRSGGRANPSRVQALVEEAARA